MSARFFLKFLAVIYFIAFWSLSVQILGLIGSQGILPVGNFLQAAQDSWGTAAFWKLPTLCWFNHSDGFLLFLCGAGMVFSVALAAGILPWLNALIVWVLYLSLTVAAQDFLGFQWENLLLEVGFLSIFLFPARCSWRPCAEGPSIVAVWLLRLLLFRFMLESGFVKLASNDPAWRDLSALTYHYLTQPLPHVLSWYVHQMPVWFHKFCGVGMFAVELVVPFLIFFGARARWIVFFMQVGLQLIIILTGNYCFFNLLTIALCFLLLDDAQLRKIGTVTIFPVKLTWGHKIVTVTAAVFILSINALQIAVFLHRPIPPAAQAVLKTVQPLRSINTYGLFAVMTTERNEIIIEGSRDGNTWLPYEFTYKPGDVAQAPKWVQPHQPRLDWQMWFAALGSYRQNSWFVNLMVRILQGSKPVLALLEKDPFAGAPPRYLRAAFYEYRFTNFEQRRKTGAWWNREFKGYYMPTMQLR